MPIEYPLGFNEDVRKKVYARAIRAYRRSNESRWVFAYFSSRIVGTYGLGGTRGLADDANVSPDTVEDHAHAYWMFEKLKSIENEKYYVNNARKLPYIYVGHFRALYDLQVSHNLTDEQIASLFMDIVQAEGGISTRKLEDHARSRFGDTRTWEFYARKALKELSKTEGQPDLPNIPERIGNLYAIVLTTDDGPVQFFVTAHNDSRAEAIARKQLAKDRGDELEKKSICKARNLISEDVLTDSKHILNVTSSWLGDHA